MGNRFDENHQNHQQVKAGGQQVKAAGKSWTAGMLRLRISAVSVAAAPPLICWESDSDCWTLGSSPAGCQITGKPPDAVQIDQHLPVLISRLCR